MKEFDINLAKQGKPICTRDGRKARIICWDLKNDGYCLVAAVETKDNGNLEEILTYDEDGIFTTDHEVNHNYDLRMAPEERQISVNIYKNKNGIYVSKVRNNTDMETLNLASSFLIGTICVTLEDNEIVNCSKVEKTC